MPGCENSFQVGWEKPGQGLGGSRTGLPWLKPETAGVTSLWLLPALCQPFLVGWSQADPGLLLGQWLWTAPDQAVLCFSSQYYEMSYGLNIEMHKQVSAGGAGPAAGEGGGEAKVGVFVGK